MVREREREGKGGREEEREEDRGRERKRGRKRVGEEERGRERKREGGRGREREGKEEREREREGKTERGREKQGEEEKDVKTLLCFYLILILIFIDGDGSVRCRPPLNRGLWQPWLKQQLSKQTSIINEEKISKATNERTRLIGEEKVETGSVCLNE